MVEEKLYEEYVIQFPLKSGSRTQLRTAIVEAFLNEKPGYWEKGVKHVTRYKYFVETLVDNRKIFLLRPTFLNKGIDFQVWVEQFKEEQDAKPSHKDILEDLKMKKKKNAIEFKLLFEAIERIWECEEPTTVLKDYSFSFKKGLSVELILKVLKWLFIEQDITYWNYTGRGMLFEAIKLIK